ncbi:hypothetical protein DMH25_32590 [Streptomyces sp. WAC 01325]|nr:hypothetical protein DMH25_32590 [Streptomyces sp. WAC 01325]
MCTPSGGRPGRAAFRDGVKPDSAGGTGWPLARRIRGCAW